MFRDTCIMSKEKKTTWDVKHQIQKSGYWAAGKGICDRRDGDWLRETKASAVLDFLSKVVSLEYFIISLSGIEEKCGYEKGNGGNQGMLSQRQVTVQKDFSEQMTTGAKPREGGGSLFQEERTALERPRGRQGWAED